MTTGNVWVSSDRIEVCPTLWCHPTRPCARRASASGPSIHPDVDAIMQAGRDPDIVRHTFMPQDPDEATVEKWIDEAITGWSHGRARFALFRRDDPDRSCLGQVGLVAWKHPVGNAEGFYWLLPDARGRGFATEALIAMSTWAFETGVERLELLIDLDNPASQRTAIAAGFQREGVLRGYERVRDRRVDLWSFARLASDDAALDMRQAGT